eukprot:5219120-Prymnesium_polylepis.1
MRMHSEWSTSLVPEPEVRSSTSRKTCILGQISRRPGPAARRERGRGGNTATAPGRAGAQSHFWSGAAAQQSRRRGGAAGGACAAGGRCR